MTPSSPVVIALAKALGFSTTDLPSPSVISLQASTDNRPNRPNRPACRQAHQAKPGAHENDQNLSMVDTGFEPVTSSV